MKYEHELQEAVRIAREAGEIFRSGFLANPEITLKADGTPVTLFDQEINELVIKELTTTFPDDGVFGEETKTAELGAGRVWVCDPIDGTIAFIEGVATATFSLGLVVDGAPQVGVIYNPMLDDMYTASRGGGAFVNNTEISVSTKGMSGGTVAVTSDQSRIAMGIPYVQKLAQSDSYITSFSGAAYKACLVARGVFVGSVSGGVGPVDLAAGALIVEEAGGMTTNKQGQPLDFSAHFAGAVLSNGSVHPELVSLFE